MGTERNIVSYYENNDEDSRIIKPLSRRTEFLTTDFILERYLEPGSRILDIGSGPGIYSVHYAQKGFRVYARDIVPHNIEILKAKPECSGFGINTGVADARDLSEFSDSSFDAVLCLGPIYHFGRTDDRNKCISECLRVLRPGGVLAVSYILKFFVYMHVIRRGSEYLTDEVRNQIMDSETALREVPENIWFFDSPSEIGGLLGEFSITKLTNAGTDGIAVLMADTINSFSESEYEMWLKYHFATCEEPSILGYSNHGLYVCRKAG